MHVYWSESILQTSTSDVDDETSQTDRGLPIIALICLLMLAMSPCVINFIALIRLVMQNKFDTQNLLCGTYAFRKKIHIICSAIEVCFVCGMMVGLIISLFVVDEANIHKPQHDNDTMEQRERTIPTFDLVGSFSESLPKSHIQIMNMDLEDSIDSDVNPSSDINSNGSEGNNSDEKYPLRKKVSNSYTLVFFIFIVCVAVRWLALVPAFISETPYQCMNVYALNHINEEPTEKTPFNGQNVDQYNTYSRTYDKV